MRRRTVRIMGIAAALVLTAAVMPAASAAALPSCSKGTKVQTVKGKSTMIYKGKRVACKAATAKPTASPTLAPSLKPEIRFSGGKINDLVIKPNLTITLRNFETGKRTLVITGTDYNFQADVVDPIVDSVAGMGAFMSPAKPGTYTMYFLENPSVKATLTVIP